MIGFDLFEFVQQSVEFQVADNRRIQDMIAIIVGVDLLFEFFVTGFFVHALNYSRDQMHRIALFVR